MSKGKVLLNISIVCIFIAVIITFVFLSINGCVKYYTPYEVNDISNQQFIVRDCVDDCEMDNHECISSLPDVVGYVSYSKALSCAYNLEFCIDDCEDEYG